MIDPEVLRQFPFFAILPTDKLQEIIDSASRFSLIANTQVFEQGKSSTGMYLILNGGVRVEHNDGEGRNISLGELGENQVFGDLAMLASDPHQVRVTTTCDSEFLVIDRPMMLNIINKLSPDEILDQIFELNKRTHALDVDEFQELLKLRTMEAQMEAEKQRNLTQMVAGVAHEINTPLGVINTAVSIIARELALPQEMTTQRAADVAESLELMRRNVERAHKLIQDFKKVSVSQLSDEKETVNISDVLCETIDLLMVNLRRRQITVNLDDRLALDQKTWFGYRGCLSQILINLLTNIERYAYPNGKGGVVEVSIFLEGADYIMTVRDFGAGISADDQHRVFDPFFTTGRPIGGTGLGLAIVHDLVVNALNGDVKMNSEVGSGTEFIISFPRETPA